MSMKFTRRETLAGLGGVSLAALSAGAPDFALAQAPKITRGGRVTFMRESDASSLDPLLGNATTIQRKVYNVFVESLLVQTKAGEFEPWLAESYQVTDGGKTITFKIRKGVVFHDGTPMDGEAVAFNLKRLIDPNFKAYPRQYVSELKAVDLIDPDTVRLTLSLPSVLMLPMMASEAGAMMSPKALREMGKEIERMPVATGPFKVVGRTTGEITLDRFDKYWRMGADGQRLPYLDGVKIVINPDSAVRLLQMKSGTAQMSEGMFPKDVPSIEADKSLKFTDAKLGAAFVLNFNVTRPPFDNIELRKALTHSIDREALMKVMSRGTGEILRGIEPSHSWLYDERVVGHKFDVAAAKAAWAKSGYSGPVVFTIQLRDDDQQVATILQQMWKQAGIDVRLESLERGAFNEKTLSTRTYHITLSRSPLVRPDVHVQYVFAYSRNGSTNYSGFKNEEIHGLVDQAQVQLDNVKRKELYVKIQQLVIENYYQSFLFWNPGRDILAANLFGVKYDASTVWSYEDLWLQKA